MSNWITAIQGGLVRVGNNHRYIEVLVDGGSTVAINEDVDFEFISSLDTDVLFNGKVIPKKDRTGIVHIGKDRKIEKVVWDDKP